MNPIKIISVGIAIIIAGIALYSVFKTNLLREKDDDKSPYSFSKFQLWLWTVTICPIFAIHWGHHSPAEPTINDLSLTLLGITVGVALTSNIISQTQKASNAKKILKNSNEELPDLKSESKDSVNFFINILTGDNDELSIQRLQNLVFTFVYVVVYITIFFNTKEYPEFDLNKYLILATISSGAYLIGKGMNK